MHQQEAGQGVVRIHALPTLFNLAEGLVYQLEENARQGALGGMPVVVTSAVSIDNLAETSRFGRLLSEAIGSELFRRGADVRDIRNTGSLQVMPLEGEMALSRQAEMLARQVDAQAVVVGTYGLTDASVVVNIRMLDIATGRIFSVAMSEIARTSTIESMLHPEGFSQGGELGGPTTFDRLQE
jgi:TolB-like protein